MAHSRSARSEDIERRQAQRRADARRDAEAIKITDAWNARLARGERPQFSPTLEAAVRAQRPWLRLGCDGCRTEYEIDLRTMNHPQDMPIMGLQEALRCETMCRGQGPAPTLLGLHRWRYEDDGACNIS